MNGLQLNGQVFRTEKKALEAVADAGFAKKDEADRYAERTDAAGNVARLRSAKDDDGKTFWTVSVTTAAEEKKGRQAWAVADTLRNMAETAEAGRSEVGREVERFSRVLTRVQERFAKAASPEGTAEDIRSALRDAACEFKGMVQHMAEVAEKAEVGAKAQERLIGYGAELFSILDQEKHGRWVAERLESLKIVKAVRQ